MSKKIYIKPESDSFKTDLRPLFCLTQILLKGNVDLERIKTIYNKNFLECEGSFK